MITLEVSYCLLLVTTPSQPAWELSYALKEQFSITHSKILWSKECVAVLMPGMGRRIHNGNSWIKKTQNVWAQTHGLKSK